MTVKTNASLLTMKRLPLLRVRVAVLVLLTALGCARFRRGHVTTDLEGKATNHTYKFYEAIERHDRKAFESLVPNNCVFTVDPNFKASDKPIVMNRADAIRQFDEAAQAFSISVVNTLARADESRVTVNGDLLVRYAGDKPADLSYHFNHVYTKVGDSLQLSAVEISGQDWPKEWPHTQR